MSRTAVVTGGTLGLRELATTGALVSAIATDRVSFSTGTVYDISGGRATY